MTEHQNPMSICLRLPAAIFLAGALLLAGCNNGDASSDKDAAAKPATDQAAADKASSEDKAPEETTPIPGVPLGDIAEGPVDAPVTLIEFASMTCPHCAAFQKDTYPLVKRDFVDTGKVRYIFREYPLDRFALDASVFARCAGEDKYFAVVTQLFAEQAHWMPASGGEGAIKATEKRLVDDYGDKYGVTEEKYDHCLNNKPLRDHLANRMEEARDRYDVNATPTLVINGTKYTGSHTYADVAKAINDAMPKK
ncbi:MAG: thioredoxin domain-containing protein [Alphaproteobacteria bacterium]|nr:thioredoxin domain-containing protein [Alphaproteobacteria bacterium]